MAFPLSVIGTEPTFAAWALRQPYGLPTEVCACRQRRKGALPGGLQLDPLRAGHAFSRGLRPVGKYDTCTYAGWPANRSSELTKEGKSTFAWLRISAKTTVDNLRLITERRLVDQNSASWNRITTWLRAVSRLRDAA